MLHLLLAVAVLIVAGWAIAKNYDAKVVLFAAGLFLMYAALAFGFDVLPAKAASGLAWADPFKTIRDLFVSQYSNAGLIILTLFGFAAYMSHIGANDMVNRVMTKPLSHVKSPLHSRAARLLVWYLPADHHSERGLFGRHFDGDPFSGAARGEDVDADGCCSHCHDGDDRPHALGRGQRRRSARSGV